MKYYVLIVPIIAAVALGSYFANPTNSVTQVKKQHTKLFYDRIEPDPNATMIIYRAGEMTIEGPKPCLMPRRVRSVVDGLCYLPARLPETK